MKSIQQLIRLLYINFILARNGLDQVVVSIRLFAPFRFVVYINPWNWYRKEKLSRGQALRKSLEELGPIFIKFGQALSTRPDILPEDIALELCQLQDNVPPFDSAIALRILESTYEKPVLDMFAEFDAQPLASASMAQVHAAKLNNGKSVVIKILRPNMRKIIQQDLMILETIAQLAERYWAKSNRLKPREIVREFRRSLMDELDFKKEAANGSQLRRNFEHSPLLYVPEVYWEYTRENVLVMERIFGIPVTNVEALKAHHINIPKLAERGLEIFFTQVFRDRFFHADMHPGNIFVSPLHPENPQYICVDFGIVGTLSDSDKRYIAENLVAFFNRDYYRVAQLHIESGWVERNTRIDEFENAIRVLCEPIFERPLKDISFSLLVINLFQVASRFHMEVQPQLILLQKTLLSVEGLGRQLYPDLDLWKTAKPHLEHWMNQQMGPKAFFKQLRDNLPFFIEQLPNLPRLINDVLSLSKEKTIAELDHIKKIKKNPQSKHAWAHGLFTGFFISALLIGGGAYYLFSDILKYRGLSAASIKSLSSSKRPRYEEIIR
jgi:ubiquinone biosynthesis protein